MKQSKIDARNFKKKKWKNTDAYDNDKSAFTIKELENEVS